jgi:UDP-N-acetyl-2-amino-2-deoxyglucuronate dehydrogenase
MTVNIIRLGLVGCGRVAQHYRSILESGGVDGWRISACCDLDEAKANALASAFGAPAFTDYAKMLAEVELDLVTVLTPSGAHYAHARTALEAGRHVLVEKPITLLPDQAMALDRLAADNGLMYGVVFQNRYNPAVQCLRRAIEAGRFGHRVSAAIRLRWCRYQNYYEDGWHGTWAQDGGVINQQAIHHVDALNWLCGPIEAVSATISNRVNDLEAEDTLVAALRFADGSLGTIEATTAARPEDFEASLSLVGENGIAQIGGIALNRIETWRFVSPEAGDDEVFAVYSEDVPTGYGLSHGPFLQDVINALAAGRVAPPVTAADGVEAVKLVHALYASAERETWVRLADKPLSERLGR